jgi:uncharacterized protein YbbC (DUF1343 family)
MAGIDVLEADGFKPLKDKKIGLVTNLSSVNREGVPTLDVLQRTPGVKVEAVFSPEHGLAARLDDGAPVPSSTDKDRQVKIYSLYGESTRPSPQQLQGLDLLVVDLPDVGARFYTYATTLAYCMEEAAKTGLPVMLLDRPNPINGISVEGSVLKPADYSFTGYSSVPVRHGFTLGELARFINEEKQIGVQLEVVKIQGWSREMWFDGTGLPWINPSPNLRNLTEVTLYPCVCFLEPTNLSVGRGTDSPFERFGAPWINAKKSVDLAQSLNERGLPGARFNPLTFTPTTSVFKGETCGGCQISLTDRETFRPVRTGLHLIDAILRLFGKEFKVEEVDRLLCAPKVRQALQNKVPVEEVAKLYQPEEETFRKLRKKYLLY